MADHMTESPLRDQVLPEGKPQNTPLPTTLKENCPNDIDQNATSGKECSVESPTEEDGVSSKSTNILKPTTPAAKNDQSDTDPKETQSDASSDNDLRKGEEVDKSGVTAVPINEGSGDGSGVPKETLKTTGPDIDLKKGEEVDKSGVTAVPINEGSGDGSGVPKKTLKTTGPDNDLKKGEKVDKSGVTAVPINEGSGEGLGVFPGECSKTTVRGKKNEEPSERKNERKNEEYVPQKAPAAQQTVPQEDVETIGPVPSTPNSGDAVKEPKRSKVWIAASVALVAVFLPLLLQSKDPPKKTDLHQIDIFHQEFDKMKVQFPSQREELWKRSRIHLQRYFLVAKPTEPVSIILTAGVRAEGTLRCLAQNIASVLSSALNASAIHLDGASKSTQDSDEVKSEIDGQLQKAFKGGKPIAVIHRFDELPPASTLIFYRYCDHENAAFKKTFLIFTVLLSEEEEIQANIRLSEVEEMVTDHLQKKFLSHDHPTAFDKMDIDKYGGLWSRISHLILPVATETRFKKTAQC